MAVIEEGEKEAPKLIFLYYEGDLIGKVFSNAWKDYEEKGCN
jgi:hypothetical protein